MDAPLISALSMETPLKDLSWKEIYLRGMELCALALAFREDAIYDPEVLAGRMLRFAQTGEKVTELTRADILGISAMGSRELISCLYRALRDLGGFPSDCADCLAGFPAETAAALWLFCA